MIEKERIETVKQSVDLVALVKSRGIDLKKNGKGYKGHCPFHEDNKSPSLSVTPDKNLWQCFGCNTGGDAIRFVELFDKVDFKEAVQILSADIPKKKSPAKQPAPTPALTVKDKKLLARVVAYYQHSFNEDPRGLEYLNNRGITDNQAIKDFAVGFVTGTLKEILPDDEEITKALQKIGILNKKGNECFYNSVVFPLFDENGAIVSLYGRNISDDNGVDHLYLPGPRRGLINRQAAKRSSTIILAESIIDALTLYDQGFKNVIPSYGVNGLTDDHLLFFNSRIKEVYISFDADEAGKEGAARVTEQFKEKDIVSHVVNLPDKDINIYFQRHTPEEFEILLKSANPASLETSDKINKRQQTLYREEEHGFTVGYGERQYQIKGIQRGDTQLKATIKVSKDVATNQPFELTTIDLYSSRSRQWFAKLCADLLEAAEELIKEDLGKILLLVEEWRPKEQKESTPQPTKEEQQKAASFLKNPELFSEIMADFETMGVTGEEVNKLVGYLAATSRKLADPLSVLIQSRSAAGKSTLQDAVLSLVPDEDYIKYTRVTDQALFYKDEDSLVNKILAIEEAEGMGGAAYSIRNIQSAKKITVAATGKDAATGKMRTEEYTVRGPVSVMITTTQTDVDQETASRFIFLTIDESAAMTEAIHKMQREAETLEGLVTSRRQEGIIAKHHTAQRMLKPLAVVNPFSKYLSYPNHSLRSRRDHKKYLGLIRGVAYLRQYQREVKTVAVEGKPVEYIEVTLDDIETANQLANEVLGQSMDELAKPSRSLLSMIYKMAAEVAEKQECPVDEVFFTRRLVREYTGWTDWQVKTHIRQLEDLEYITARIGAKGKEYSYVLNYQGQAKESDRCYLNLTTVDEIKRQMENQGGTGDE
ncbi:MAG: toprim domain-containing protein [Proteobacteria bacterium]|nr:toprim domain-containing protein [Pseudomonadota bacterium]